MGKLKLTEKVYRAVTNRLPCDWAVTLDRLRLSYRDSWGGPFNGQTRRCDLVRRIFREIDFDEVIETGSFRGTTTEFLSQLSGLPIHSVEVVERFYKYAALRCAPFADVHLVHGDSRTMLLRLASRAEKRRSFFYLDAHWEEDVPRHEELQIIRAHWNEAVVMIDDFEVPGDPGYGVALYGGQKLTEKYLPDMPGWRRFYPSTPSDADTGARRGCIVLATEALATKLDTIALLKAAPSVRSKRIELVDAGDEAPQALPVERWERGEGVTAPTA